MEDRRQETQHEDLSKDLIEKGKAQLEQEIEIIQGWLDDLRETREDNPFSLSARKTYEDMLQSRKELLKTISPRK